MKIYFRFIMEDTSFDKIPLLGTKANDARGDSQTSALRRRQEISSESNDTSDRTVGDPFAMSDEEFEKLSLYRPQRHEGVFTIGGVFWMLSSVWVLYYTQLPIVLKADERVDWFWLSLAGVMLLICLAIASFFIVYLSWIRKVRSSNFTHVSFKFAVQGISGRLFPIRCF